MPRSLLLYNPHAGRWSTAALVDSIALQLEQHGAKVEVAPTEAPGHATQLARQAADARAPTVFAFGGDGTLREVAAGLLGSETALGPLPGGTTNVVARALGLARHPLRAAAELATAKPHPVDVGLCGETPFLMQVSLGLDAKALARTSSRLKRWLGKAAVGAAGLLELGRYPFPELAIEVDGHPVRAPFLAVANIGLYAGGFQLVPQARFDDGRLWLLVFRTPGRRPALSFALDLARHRHLDRSDVQLFAVDQVKLIEPTTLVQVDGDPVSLPPSTLRMAREKLLLLAPQGAFLQSSGTDAE